MGSVDIPRLAIAIGTGGVSELAAAAERTKDGLERPANDAKNAADAQRRQAAQLAADAELRRSNEEGAAAATDAAAAARERQKKLAAGAQGRRSTILTGPLGVVDDANVTRKSILGA